MPQKLRLYTDYLPLLDKARKAAGEPRELGRFHGETPLADMLFDLQRAVVFDCRSLPVSFVDDTAEAAFAELKETRDRVTLPFDDDCYFEFADGVGCLAGLLFNKDEDDRVLNTEVIIRRLKPGAEADSFVIEGFAFTNFPRDEDELFSWCDHEATEAEQEECEAAAKRVAGILHLMGEHLVLDRPLADPEPEKAAKRKKRNHLPQSGASHVLAINVPAVRRASLTRSQAEDAASHASPALHWRRGHWRTLYRGSEFESRARVRPHLVGDPDRGFIRSSYRLVNEMPMMT